MIQTSFFPQPKKDEPIKIIRIDPSGLQPRKVEELLPEANMLPDTYMIYPTGGYHPFYGVPNTFPIYQQKIWPFVKRIKYKSEGSKEGMKKRKYLLRDTQHLTQSNPCWHRGYFQVSLINNFQSLRAQKKEDGKYVEHTSNNPSPYNIHRLVALAFIPNQDPVNFKLVLHKNDDATNYLIENLKWGTASENMRGTLKRRPETLEQIYLHLYNRGIIKG